MSAAHTPRVIRALLLMGAAGLALALAYHRGYAVAEINTRNCVEEFKYSDLDTLAGGVTYEVVDICTKNGGRE